MMYFMIFLITMFGGMSVVFALLFGPGQPLGWVDLHRISALEEEVPSMAGTRALVEMVLAARCGLKAFEPDGVPANLS